MSEDNSRLEGDLDLSGDSATTKQRFPQISLGQRSFPKWAAGVAIGLLAVVVVYIALIVSVSGQLPAKTTVSGVVLNGLAPAQAKAKLTKALDARAGKPITVQVNGKTVKIEAATAGLSADPNETIDSLSAFTANPIELVRRLSGNVNIPVHISVSQEKLKAAVHGLATELNVAVSEPTIVFKDGLASVVPGTPGVTLDESAGVAAISAGYLSTSKPINLPVTIVKPHANAAALAFLDQANSAANLPLVIVLGGNSTTLTPSELKAALSFTYKDGRFEPVVDGEKLYASLKATSTNGSVSPVNATFTIVAGKPIVVPGKSGQGTTPQKLAASVATVITDKNSRTVVIPMSVIEPDFTTAQANALGITEVLSTFTQHFPYAAYRVQNIGQAAKYLNGTIVKPGETFSMNDTVRERTVANGYTTGFIIGGDGLFHEDLGGGVSTSATAMWHAAFFANMVRVEQRAHSFWIARYQPGLEATVSWGNLDLKWRNPEKTGVYIAASITDTSITVTLYGTKTFDKVESESSPRTNIKPFQNIVSTDPKCITQLGVPGFDITVTRTVTKGGLVVSTEPFTTHYDPSANVVCKRVAPSATPSVKPSPSKS